MKNNPGKVAQASGLCEQAGRLFHFFRGARFSTPVVPWEGMRNCGKKQKGGEGESLEETLAQGRPAAA
jgi:hypothetical protein